MSDDIAINSFLGLVYCQYKNECWQSCYARDIVEFWDKGWRIEIITGFDVGIKIDFVCPYCQFNKIGRFV